MTTKKIKPAKPVRIDQALFDRELCESREKAKRAVIAGRVRINGQLAHKASELVQEDDSITLEGTERFVSRGGHKLEHAIGHFKVDVTGLTAADLGASTGGFTDCLLQHGVAKVFAVDVGQGQLAWKLRQDQRVKVMEKTNARFLKPSDFQSPIDVAVIDCSFISLRLLLQPACSIVRKGGKIIALVKPQFEAGRSEVSKGRGVIRDAAIHQRVLDELTQFVDASGTLRWLGSTESPLLGPAGNKEFLALIEVQSK